MTWRAFFISHAMIAGLLNVRPRSAEALQVLDLSTEGGQFPLTMLACWKAGLQIRYLAMDRDSTALELAKRLVRFTAGTSRTDGFSMKTACRDSLLDSRPTGWPSTFGAIVGNPPWQGSDWSRSDAIRAHFGPTLNGRFDVYLAFMLRAHEWLAPGGYLSLVVPNAFLFNVNAAPVRRLLLVHYDLLSLHLYPQRSFVELPCVIPISFLARKRPRRARQRPATVIVYASPGLGGQERPAGQRRVHVAHNLETARWVCIQSCRGTGHDVSPRCALRSAARRFRRTVVRCTTCEKGSR
jgi:hypothetical protein